MKYPIKWINFTNTLPNILDERVPVGGEENNLILRKVGEPKKFDFTVRTHDEDRPKDRDYRYSKRS